MNSVNRLGLFPAAIFLATACPATTAAVVNMVFDFHSFGQQLHAHPTCCQSSKGEYGYQVF
jgi:hypothetical protein